VTSLLLDPVRSRAMGEAGRKLVAKEFSIEGMVEGNLAAYRDILAPPDPRRMRTKGSSQ
jgi:hypothetical protein